MAKNLEQLKKEAIELGIKLNGEEKYNELQKMIKEKKKESGDDKGGKPAKGVVLVEFVKSWTPYVKGEVAGFEKKMADKLIEAEVAEIYKKSK